MILTEKPPVHNQLEFFIEEAVKARPVITAVVHPVEQNGLMGAIEAAERGLIVPILVGPAAKIKAAAEKYELNIDDYELINVEHSHAAAEQAVSLIRETRAETLMKGDLGTSELLTA